MNPNYQSNEELIRVRALAKKVERQKKRVRRSGVIERAIAEAVAKTPAHHG